MTKSPVFFGTGDFLGGNPMSYNYNECNAMVYEIIRIADTAAFCHERYNALREPVHLRIFAKNSIIMSLYVMKTYCMAKNIKFNAMLDYNELADKISACTDAGDFFKAADLSEWDNAFSSRYEDATNPGKLLKSQPNANWDDFYEVVLRYARDVQNFHNEFIVPAVNRLDSDESGEFNSDRRMSNFA
jgi:hypothetical protein